MNTITKGLKRGFWTSSDKTKNISKDKTAAPVFCYADGELPRSAGVKIVLGLPMTLSLHAFSFPFEQLGRIKDALKFRFLPLLGARIADAVIVPVIGAPQKTKGVSGHAWLVMKEELGEPVQGVKYWPAPLAGVCDLDEGVIMAADGELISSILLKDGVVLAYDCKPRAHTKDALAKERMRLEAWAHKLGIAGSSLVYDLELDEFARGDLLDAAARTFAAKPGMKDFDLSILGSALAESRGQSVNLINKIAKALLTTGALFSFISAALWYGNYSTSEAALKAQTRIYTAATGKPAGSDPSMSIRALAQNARTIESDRSLIDVMMLITEGVAGVKDSASGKNLKLETLRYAADRTEITGTASEAQTVQTLRDELSNGPFGVSLGDLQQIPGGGFRFIITLRGAGQ